MDDGNQNASPDDEPGREDRSDWTPIPFVAKLFMSAFTGIFAVALLLAGLDKIPRGKNPTPPFLLLLTSSALIGVVGIIWLRDHHRQVPAIYNFLVATVLSCLAVGFGWVTGFAPGPRTMTLSVGFISLSLPTSNGGILFRIAFGLGTLMFAATALAAWRAWWRALRGEE